MPLTKDEARRIAVNIAKLAGAYYAERNAGPVLMFRFWGKADISGRQSNVCF
jgi:hypothetical protein